MKATAIALATALAAASALPAPAARADTLLIQRVAVASKADLPRRGASMHDVEARYGAPAEKYAPGGGGSGHTPPITRWAYPTFSVYFEHSHVVDAVLNKAGPLEIGPAPVAR
jgi:hypothetical protein